MTGRRPDAYYIALERRLRALEPRARAVLAAEPYSWFKEYLDAGEYGLAVEVALEELPDGDHTPAARELAAALRREAEAMGLAGSGADFDDRMQAITSRLAVAEPPPWSVETTADGVPFIRTGRKDRENRLFVRHDLEPAPASDLTFIVLARNVLDRLAAAIERDDLGSLTRVELAELDDAARRATSGPWTPFVEDRQPIGGTSVIWLGGDDHGPDMYLWLGDAMAPGHLVDFVAHVRTDAPFLAGEIRRRRA